MMTDEIKNTTDLLAQLPVPIEPELPAQLVPRPQALPLEDFAKIEKVLQECIRIEPVMEQVNVPVKDDLGNIVRWEFDLRETGVRMKALKAFDPRVFDAVKRPATPAHVTTHLTRLAAHLRFTKGGKAWSLVAEDVAHDLVGVSEWAVMKACAEFRSGDKPFFPDTPELLQVIRKWHDFAKRMGEDQKPAQPAKKAPAEQRHEKTPERRAAVAKTMHLAGFHGSIRSIMADTCELCRAEIEAERKA